MGRPAAFNREQVLDQVTDLFWKRGYLGTSIADVVGATALKPGSIYNAFDSKQKLLLDALERYASAAIQRTRDTLATHSDVQTALESLLFGLVERCLDDDDGKGCLMLNIWQELSAHDPQITDYLNGVFAEQEGMVCKALEEAKRRGELKADANPAELAKYLLMSMWGIRVMSRTRPGETVLRTLAENSLMPVRAAFV